MNEHGSMSPMTLEEEKYFEMLVELIESSDTQIVAQVMVILGRGTLKKRKRDQRKSYLKGLYVAINIFRDFVGLLASKNIYGQVTGKNEPTIQ